MLTIENLHKTYQMGKVDVNVLKGVDCEINEGQVAAIIGPSGVGKSTLLHIMGALDRPNAGFVTIAGTDVFALNDSDLAQFRNRSIGFVFQFHHLLPEFSALENVMMPALISRADPDAIRERAIGLLERVDLADRMNHRPGELSGGEQQRTAVARALINSPRLILADEPSGNLDLASSKSLHQLFWDLNNELNQTIVLVTHNMDLAKRADRIIELFDGRVKSDSGTYQEEMS
jgi:lipoprotein-releasing system ATP-binding protein